MSINIPPVEYCSIARAAEIFNFKAEDILHFHIIGLIRIKILFFGSVASPEFEASPCYIHDDISCSVAGPGLGQGTISTIKEQSFRADDIPRRIILNDLGDGSEPEHILPEVGFFIIKNAPLHVGLHGFFDVEISDKDSMGACSGEIAEWLKIGVINDNSRLSLLINYKKNILPFLRISHADLCRIKMAINNELPTEIKPNTGLHHVTEYSSSIREVVLSAAIHAKEKWPDHCNSSSKWTETICRESRYLFKSENPPIAADLISRILSAAVKRGQPYRR